MVNFNRNSDGFDPNDMGDFVVRDNSIPLWKLLALFLCGFAVLYGVATHAEMVGGHIGVAVAIFAVVAPMAWFTIYYSQQNRDMLLSAEFQNALFSAAARLKTKFVMIIKQDGTVFYFDRGFQKVFPETNSRGTLMIDKLFNSEQLSKAEADKLARALAENRSESIYVNLSDAEGRPRQIIITVDPLPRPAGFYILRGRDYVVKQYERAPRPVDGTRLAEDPYVSATMAHMMHTMPYGLYATDHEGRITFINYRLETWLGYGQNEVISRNLTLSDLIPQQDAPILDQLLQKDCEGDLYLLNKNGHMVPVSLQQEICRDSKGAIIGSVGFLPPEDNHYVSLNAPSTSKPAAQQAPAPQPETPQAAPSLTAGKTL